MLAIATGCATARTRVLQPLAAPVRAVAITIDPIEGTTRAELDDLARALATPLSQGGVRVEPAPRDGAAELLGHLADYRPGVHLTAIWVVLDARGDVLGQLRTDYGISMGLDAADWGDVLQGTGASLAQFLAAEP